MIEWILDLLRADPTTVLQWPVLAGMLFGTVSLSILQPDPPLIVSPNHFHHCQQFLCRNA